jgi:Tle cognate immunity protein 4 C-terminal domain
VYTRELVYLTAGSEPDRVLDGYVARDGGVFFFHTSADADERIREFADFLVEIEPKLSILSVGEIPKSPGFCVGEGLIATNPKRGESVRGWSWILPDHPDVSFGLSMLHNGDKVGPGIVDRESDILREAGKLMKNIRTLRKRRFDLAGMKAQEWSVEITDEQPQFSFDIEIPGKPNDNANPSIHLGMRVGGNGAKGYEKPTLTKGEALALWDALIQTLRPRPGAF